MPGATIAFGRLLQSTDPQPHTPVQSSFYAYNLGIPTPQSAKAKVKRRESALGRDNACVGRILKDIADSKSLSKVQLKQLIATKVGQVNLSFKVSHEEFETGKADKEDVEGYEYIYSYEEIIIKADAAAVHKKAVRLCPGNFAESTKNLDTSLGEDTSTQK
jgi:hypothetical protein